MRKGVKILTLLVTFLGAVAKELYSAGSEVRHEEQDIKYEVTTITKGKIRVEGTTFRCKLRLVHDSTTCNTGKDNRPSTISCTPKNPKNLKAYGVKVKARGYTFTLNIKINPSSIEKCSISPVEVVVGAEVVGENMPNINYILRGYNIMKGNPHQVGVSTVDPGFQEPIFSLSYKNKETTPDWRYLQPDGTLITMCQACSLSAVTKITSGMTAYTNSLSEKVKVTGRYGALWRWWEHRFSWSTEYQKIHSGIYQHSNYYTHSDASCCAYQIQTDTYSRPPFSKDFEDGLDALPDQYDGNEEEYKKFIEAFGTHYIKQADMGSLFGQQTKISQKSWAHMVATSLDIEKASSWSAMFASGTYNASFESKSTLVNKFNEYSSSQLLYTKGSKPPKGNSIEIWINETKKYPAPISLELGSILNLFDDDVKHGQMKLALDDYCGSNCGELGEDPWLTNLNVGQRSQPKDCGDGYVTSVQISRAALWNWWDNGIYDLCFKCSNDHTTTQCFNDTVPPPDDYLGFDMICPENGFERMTTFTPDFYKNTAINIKAQCNRDAEPQYAFYYDPIEGFFGTWAPWVSCHDSKINGFQVLRNYDNKIVNFRIKCE